MLCHTQSVVNGRIGARSIQTGSSTHIGSGYASHAFKAFRGMFGLGHKFTPLVEALVVTTVGHIVFGHQTFGDHDMRQ